MKSENEDPGFFSIAFGALVISALVGLCGGLIVRLFLWASGL